MSFLSLFFHISHYFAEIGSFRQKTIRKSNAKSQSLCHGEKTDRLAKTGRLNFHTKQPSEEKVSKWKLLAVFSFFLTLNKLSSNGAGDEIRTHDIYLGKVTLYP